MKYVPQPTSENKDIIYYNKHKKARNVLQATSAVGHVQVCRTLTFQRKITLEEIL